MGLKRKYYDNSWDNLILPNNVFDPIEIAIDTCVNTGQFIFSASNAERSDADDCVHAFDAAMIDLQWTTRITLASVTDFIS